MAFRRVELERDIVVQREGPVAAALDFDRRRVEARVDRGEVGAYLRRLAVQLDLDNEALTRKQDVRSIEVADSSAGRLEVDLGASLSPAAVDGHDDQSQLVGSVREVMGVQDVAGPDGLPARDRLAVQEQHPLLQRHVR